MEGRVSVLFLSAFWLLSACAVSYAAPAKFMVLGDWGMGNAQQHGTAAQMKAVATAGEADFVVNVGDNFYKSAGMTLKHGFEEQGGVTNLSDPLWKRYFEDVYNGSLKDMKFLTVLGNHDYMGNVTAQLLYHAVDERWVLPSHYYSQTVQLTETNATFFFLDTNVFIQDYIDHPENQWMAENLATQDYHKQLAWLDSTLAATTTKWKIVVGHHPIVAHPGRTLYKSQAGVSMDMVAEILKKHGAQVYFCGHVHDLEHSQDTDLDYFISGGGGFGKVYDSDPVAMSKLNFLSKDAGFMVVTLDAAKMDAYYRNTKGEHIYNATVMATK